MKVLVTVKAAPQPSATYGDTVCVAGVELRGDDPVRLVRLYPVPFRYLEGDQQFGKYQVIDVAARPSTRDPRPESHRIDASSLRLGESVKGWHRRAPYLEPLVTDSMCAVLDAVRQNPNAPSLALVRPAEILGLQISRHGGWTPKQQDVLDQWVNQPELFGGGAPKTAIAAPRFTAQYRYRCGDARCRTHEQGIIDWELTALQRKLALASDAELQAAIVHNFFEVMCGSTRSPAFYVGNQADAQKRRTFSVLGTYYPRAFEAAALPLF